MGKKFDTLSPIAAVAAPALSTTPSPAASVVALGAAPKPASVATNGKPATTTAKKKPAAKRTAKKPTTNKAITFSTEDIALRAYFIAEDRQRNGIHGDPESDWIEAERQLKSEARKKKAAPKTAGSRKKKA